MKISVIIPVYNEVESINELYKQLLKALQEFSRYEIIFIDDGSSDGSVETIKKISELLKDTTYNSIHLKSLEPTSKYIGKIKPTKEDIKFIIKQKNIIHTIQHERTKCYMQNKNTS